MTPIACPVCARPFEVAAVADPVALPCGACWRNLSPAAKAPFVLALRTAPAARRILGHRDPIPHCPPSVRAYVMLLESMLGGAP